MIYRILFFFIAFTSIHCILAADFTKALFNVNLPSPERPIIQEETAHKLCPHRGFSRFDMFHLVMTWQITMCHKTRYHFLGSCKPSQVLPRFTIDSFRAFKLHRIAGKKFQFAQCCDKEDKFSYKEILNHPTLKDDLKHFWSDIYNVRERGYEGDFGVWKRNWEKYGTCIKKHHSQLKTQNDYFEKIINMSKHLEIADTLAKHGIHPNNTRRYSFQKIVSIIKEEYGIEALPKCVWVDGYDYPCLQQLWFCVDKNLTILKECPKAAKDRFQSCWTDEIIYPEKNREYKRSFVTIEDDAHKKDEVKFDITQVDPHKDPETYEKLRKELENLEKEEYYERQRKKFEQIYQRDEMTDEERENLEFHRRQLRENATMRNIEDEIDTDELAAELQNEEEMEDFPKIE